MGSCSIAGLHTALNLQVPFIHLGRERHCESCVIPKYTTQYPRPGLKPGQLDLEMSALTVGPLCLHILGLFSILFTSALFGKVIHPNLFIRALY